MVGRYVRGYSSGGHLGRGFLWGGVLHGVAKCPEENIYTGFESGVWDYWRYGGSKWISRGSTHRYCIGGFWVGPSV